MLSMPSSSPGPVSVGSSREAAVRVGVGRGVVRLELVDSSSPPNPKKPLSSSSIVGVGVAEVLVRVGGEEEVSSLPKPKSPARPPPVSVGSALLVLRVVGSLGAGGPSGSSIVASGLGEGGEDVSMTGSCRRSIISAGMVGIAGRGGAKEVGSDRVGDGVQCWWKGWCPRCNAPNHLYSGHVWLRVLPYSAETREEGLQNGTRKELP